MPVSIQGLYATVLSCCGTAGAGTLACCQFSGAYTFLKSTVQRVSTFSGLPCFATNTGRMIFVNDVCQYYYSNGLEWTNCFSSIPTSQDSLIYMWGVNRHGQLGNYCATTAFTSSPGTVSGNNLSWTKIATGGSSSAGIKKDGTLWTWGQNCRSELGDNSAIFRSSPGTVAGGGTNWCTVSISGAVTASGGTTSVTHMLAVKTDGTLWVWGNNTVGEAGINSCGGLYLCSPRTTSGGGTNWCQVSAATNASFAIKSDGTIWTWGCNNCGQLGTNSVASRSSPGTVAGGGTTWCQISSKWRHAGAVKNDGTLWTWGSNICGALGTGDVVSRSSPDTVVGGGTTWCQISFGYSLSSAIKTDGTLWTWGINNCGQLGDNSTTNRCSPVTLSGAGTTWCCVSAGGNCDANTVQRDGFMAALKTDGTLWTWGMGCIQGNNANTYRLSPGTVFGMANLWCTISAGPWHVGGVVNCIRGFNSN
jgi:hypothetical protein